MNQLWHNWLARFSSLQLREKYLMLLVGVFLIGYLIAWFYVIPPFGEAARLNERVESGRSELKQLQQQGDILQQGMAHNYGAKLQQEIMTLQETIRDTDQALHSFGQGFIAADKMPQVLQRMLGQQKGVQLTGFEVLSAKAIALGEQKPSTTLFYEHPMRLTIRGDYFALLGYLEHLKAIPEKLFIRQMDYHVIEYPKAELQLELATVSTNERFFAL